MPTPTPRPSPSSTGGAGGVPSPSPGSSGQSPSPGISGSPSPSASPNDGHKSELPVPGGNGTSTPTPQVPEQGSIPFVYYLVAAPVVTAIIVIGIFLTSKRKKVMRLILLRINFNSFGLDLTGGNRFIFELTNGWLIGVIGLQLLIWVGKRVMLGFQR